MRRVLVLRWMAPLVLMLMTTPALADEIRLLSGDVLHGKVLERTDLGIVLEHPDLGKISISMDKVDKTLAVEPVPEVKAVAEKPPPAPPPGWKFAATFGGAFTNDNEGEDLDLNARIILKRELPDRSTKLDTHYIFGLKNDQDTDNALRSIFTQRYELLDTPWSYFGTAR